uniref:Uncharacterized protein n=1 Tax=Rhizophora mucronata TaxID=61149 RepID=A0A2P2PCC9_RHIMU
MEHHLCHPNVKL